MVSATPVHSRLRIVRGGMLAASSTALTVGAHGVACGGVPDVGLLLVPTALMAWAGMALADRRPSHVGTLAVLGASQLVMHVLLSMSTPLGYPTPPVTQVVPGPVTMTLGHAGATVVLALLLARADVLLVAVASAVSAAVARPLPRLTRCFPTPALIVPVDTEATERRVLLTRILTRRGPPLGC